MLFLDGMYLDTDAGPCIRRINLLYTTSAIGRGRVKTIFVFQKWGTDTRKWVKSMCSSLFTVLNYHASGEIFDFIVVFLSFHT